MTETIWGGDITLPDKEMMLQKILVTTGNKEEFANALVSYLESYAGVTVNAGHFFGEVIVELTRYKMELNAKQAKSPDLIKGQKLMDFARAVVEALAAPEAK